MVRKFVRQTYKQKHSLANEKQNLVELLLFPEN